jgi:DNA mismatch endonuclease (patch repair protein)
MPKSNRDYWNAKTARNQERDASNQELLKSQGWEVYVAWECRVRSIEGESELKAFLESDPPPADSGYTAKA